MSQKSAICLEPYELMLDDGPSWLLISDKTQLKSPEFLSELLVQNKETIFLLLDTERVLISFASPLRSLVRFLFRVINAKLALNAAHQSGALELSRFHWVCEVSEHAIA